MTESLTPPPAELPEAADLPEAPAPQRNGPAESALAWAASQVGAGAVVMAATGLREGGNPWLLRIRHDGGTVEAVLKTMAAGRSAAFATELAALRLAAERGVPAPRVLAHDADGAAAGAPAVLATVLPGRSTIPIEPSPERLRVLGATVAGLSAVLVPPSPALPLRSRPIPASDFARDRRLGTDPTSPLLAEADQRVGRLPAPAGHPALVHADLWQGNLMWEGDRLSGVLDWEMAGVGHYGIDLSSVRLDAALMFGPEAAGPVLTGWERATGEPPEELAYWDVVAALNQPGDMATFAPTIQDQGRPDLTAAILNHRRDAFLRAALDRLP